MDTLNKYIRTHQAVLILDVSKIPLGIQYEDVLKLLEIIQVLEKKIPIQEINLN